MPHAMRPLGVEGRRRLVKPCQTRPIAHVANPNGAPAWLIEQSDSWRREHEWSGQRITHEPVSIGL